ncbi:molybdopterin-dependent oxidoreductase [Aquipuribacter hungaricus]|uniref:Molybdopterin-dependent oxidoreductase n=2 Tax=Aquipuribacter hungaricus TaxID=545624 RepID=A0ABV7WLY5_9MICO
MTATTTDRPAAPPAPVRRSTGWAAAAGVVAAGAGIAAAEVVGVVTGPGSTPVLAVSDLVVDLTPAWAKDAAIAVFGTADKLFLLTVVALVAAAVAAAAGVLESRRPGWGTPVTALLAVACGAAALTRPDLGVLGVLPAVVAGVVGVLLLRALLARVAPAPAGHDLDGTAGGTGAVAGGARAVAAPGDPRRRAVLLGGTGAVALGTGLGARAVSSARAGGARSRAAVVLPAAAEPLPPVEASATFDAVRGITPFRTPSRDFYRIDTALVVPSLTTADWSLRITGLVEREVELGWDDVLARSLVERWTTLSCVSNPVGGDLVGNALWRGVRTADLLAEAGPLPGADMVLSRSVDGWTAGTPVEALTDDRGSMLAVGMDGQPLPVEHGFPARLVVPGLYGYVSATKWVVEMQLTRFANAQGYWTPRGWSALGPVKISSRIDVPGGTVPAGPTVVAGVAWAMDVGVDAVQVRVDGGPWAEADLSDAGTSSTWRQWRWEWDATPGTHELQVRAVDAAGEVQPEEPAAPAPDGAQGYDRVEVVVEG